MSAVMVEMVPRPKETVSKIQDPDNSKEGLKAQDCPSWFSSVDRASAHGPKGPGFNVNKRTYLGCVQEATN